MLQRSHTAPSGLSPNRATFEASRKPTEERGRPHDAKRSLKRPTADRSTEKTLQPVSFIPVRSGTKPFPRHSQANKRTLEEEHGEELILGSQPLKPLVEQVEEEEAAWKKPLPPKPSAMAANMLVESIRQRGKLSC